MMEETVHGSETEQTRRLRILRRFVKRRRQRQPALSNNISTGSTPLFTDFLNISYDEKNMEGQNESSEEDDGDDEDNDNEVKVVAPPQQIIIDVDVELGLKPRTVVAKGRAVPDATSSANTQLLPKAHPSKQQLSSKLSPQDEGYYEGCVSPMTMAEDSHYLTDLQSWIRQNLEIFSAGPEDVGGVGSAAFGRRSAVVQGKVGIRCIHCAAAFRRMSSSMENPAAAPSSAASFPNQMRFQWPPAAVSYPQNLNGIYSACSQKPQLHFNHCPYLPEEQKVRLKSLLMKEGGAGGDRPAKRIRGVPSSVYFTIAAKRIGLMDVAGDGMRFGRDLKLEPLPFETVYAQIQDEKSMSNTTSSTAGVAFDGDAVVAEGVPSSSGGGATGGAPAVVLARLTDDAASEQVLAEAVAEPDDPTKLLARSGDKSLISDYIFLTLRQMAICHAVPMDFSTRGKKTKLMRVGFAGFCCRHCGSSSGTSAESVSFASCRSFCSAADNLSSAISNAFTAHCQKCPAVPPRIKKALVAYKRIHQRQMTQLPYGSQRRMFREMWARLRAADKSEAEMEGVLARMQPKGVPPAAVPAAAPTPSQQHATKAQEPLVSLPPPQAVPEVLKSGDLADTASAVNQAVPNRPTEFPASNNPETVAILHKFTTSWDPASNDFLILPEDKCLVSDYVFLTMRQLKVALPTSTDAIRVRRGVPIAPTFPGVCCVHCADQPHTVSPAGRSFPSAPDNFASALNTSLYNHMQACPYVPPDMKRALADVRKLHSTQCSSVKFGSQRRFFNRLFDRLRRIQSSQANGTGGMGGAVVFDPSAEVAEAGFLQLPSRNAATLFVCGKCNMVPLQFRAKGAVFHGERPSGAVVREHKQQCKGGRLELTMAAQTFRSAAASLNKSPLELLSLDLFKAVLKNATGWEDEPFEALHRDLCRVIENGGISCTEQLDLWENFHRKGSYAFAKASFVELSTQIGAKSTKIEDFPDLWAFLLLFAPGLQIV